MVQNSYSNCLHARIADVYYRAMVVFRLSLVHVRWEQLGQHGNGPGEGRWGCGGWNGNGTAAEMLRHREGTWFESTWKVCEGGRERMCPGVSQYSAFSPSAGSSSVCVTPCLLPTQRDGSFLPLTPSPPPPLHTTTTGSIIFNTI